MRISARRCRFHFGGSGDEVIANLLILFMNQVYRNDTFDFAMGTLTGAQSFRIALDW